MCVFVRKSIKAECQAGLKGIFELRKGLIGAGKIGLKIN